MKKLLFVIVFLMGFSVCAHAEDINKSAQQVAADLQKSGVIGHDEVSIVTSSVKTLVKNGAAVSEARAVVAQAVWQAKLQGLKGKNLAVKVNEAVKIRKAQMDELKKKTIRPSNQANKKGGEIDVKAGKEQKSSRGKWNKGV